MQKIDISYRRILIISAPVMMTQLTYSAMGFIDTVMVGTLGVNALAGVGLGAMVVWWIISFLHGALSGVNTAVAQAEGAGDARAAGVSLWQGVWMGCGAGLVLVAVWPLIPAFFEWIDPEPEVLAVTVPYMKVRLLGVLTLVPLVVADGFYRGLGRTTVPMIASLAQLVLNCGLNWVLIFGKLGAPELGAPGTAVGTVIAQSIVGSLLFLGLLFGRFGARYSLRSTWRFDRRVMRGLIAISLPIGLQSFMEMGGVSVFSIVIARLGAAEMAATQAVIQNWALAFMAGFAMSVTATTLVGQCVGAGEPERGRRVVGRVLFIGSVLMCLLATVYLGLPEHLMAIFAHGEDLELLRPYARPLFTIVAVCLLLDLAFMVFSGSLRGAGDTAFPMWVNIASAWLLFVPAVLFVTPRWGMVAAWWCFVLHLTVMSTVLGWRLRGDSWMGKSMRDRLHQEVDEVEAPAAARSSATLAGTVEASGREIV